MSINFFKKNKEAPISSLDSTEPVFLNQNNDMSSTDKTEPVFTENNQNVYDIPNSSELLCAENKGIGVPDATSLVYGAKRTFVDSVPATASVFAADIHRYV